MAAKKKTFEESMARLEEIVTALDGTLDLESALGAGTTVKIRLPLYQPEIRRLNGEA